MKLYPGFFGHLRLLLSLALASTTALRAADPVPGTYPLLTPQQLEQLLGPIALYPDPLIALILPASTTPADVVLAARYLSSGGDPTQIDSQPWSESIRALSRYPAVVNWMDENLQWTRELGGAFLTQPESVMKSVQQLRARARASGALRDTREQQIVVDDGLIQILPAQPEVVYVPYYDPAVVYAVQQPGYYYPYGAYPTFGVGFPVGIWLSYYPDWHDHAIVVGGRHHNWHERRDWDHHPQPGKQHSKSYNDNWHTWKPSGVHGTPSRPDPYRAPREVSRPRPFPGSPAYSSNPHARDDDHPRSKPVGYDSDRNRPPRPPNGNSPENQNYHNQSPEKRPPSSRPASSPSAVPPPHTAGPNYQPAPAPTGGPAVNHDSHDRGRAAPPPAPRPDTYSSPVNQPRASAPPGTPSSSVMSPHAPGPALPPPSVTSRPPPSNPPPRPVSSPPPLPSSPRDSSRDTQPEEAR